jgi:ppGpp synthetase/RelA/SpoT-type nucleotidyltranferase
MSSYKATYKFDANIPENLADEILKKKTPSVTQRVKKLEKFHEKLKRNLKQAQIY